MSQISKYPTLNQAIESLVGNDGIIVPPFYDGVRWDVFVLGAGHINTTGNLALSTLTINLDGGIADTYITDAGSANPINYILEVLGGSNINTASPILPGNSIIINLDDNVYITGSFIADGDITSTAGDISATLGFLNAGTTVTAGTGITSTTGNITASAGNVVITAGNLNLPNTNAAGTEGEITLGGNRWISNFGANNTFVGQSSGNTATTGVSNSAFGTLALTALTTGIDNVAVGTQAAQAITTGDNNTIIGSGALIALSTGSNNIVIGGDSAANYVTNESSNICIGNAGVLGESNIIRLGTDGAAAGQQTDCYIAGNTRVTRNLMLPNTNAAGTVGEIQFNSNRWISNYGTNNAFVGENSGNTTLTVANAVDNTGVGSNTLNDLVGTGVGDAKGNVCLGTNSGSLITDGSFNLGSGATSLSDLTTGSNNCACGYGALDNLVIGNFNIAVGSGAGSAYVGAESSNICIGDPGVAADANTIRIGTQGVLPGEQDTTFIAGIRGVAPVTTDAGIVMISSAHQLGSTAALTNGQIVIGSTGLNPILGNITSNYLTVTSGAGTIAIETKAVLQTDTGWETWGGAGNYFDDTVLGTFTLLRPGTGYINGLPVAWVAPQAIVGMVAGNTYYLYIDAAGFLQAINVRTDALFQDNIVLFECLRDSTPITNNQVTVKENHPFTMPVETSNYLHDVVGSVIENNQGGANITLNGTQGIQINGDDFLADHGLETVIPDSAGVAVVWNRYYTNAGGLWARQNSTNTFTGFYNNAGVATALSANRFAVYRLYASKNNLNSATPVYFAVLHTAEFNSLVAANTAIANGTIVGATTELASLELAQLGYIVYSQASASIVNVVIQKATLRQTISTTGTSVASLVTTNTTDFNNILSAADTNVQSALNTIDNLQVARWSVEAVNLNGVVNRGYLANKAGRLDIALPAVSSVGDIIRVVNISATPVGWRVTQAAGQQIWIGPTFATLGAGGYIEAIAIGDAIELVCYDANLFWIATGAPQGNITIV